MPSLPSSLALTTIADGSARVAAPVRNNYSAIQTAVNALIAALNVDAKGDLLVATADGTLVNLAVGSNGQVLVADSTQAAGVKWAGTGYLAAPQKYTSLIDVVSSTTETDILQSAGYSIPGNTLGANGMVRVTITGDHLNNSGGGSTLTFRIYFGGTKIYETSLSISSGVTRNPADIHFLLHNRGATNSQWMGGALVLSRQISPGAVGEGDALTAGGSWGGPFALATDPAKDTTAAQTLRVTIQHSVNSANTSFRAYGSLIEFI